MRGTSLKTLPRKGIEDQRDTRDSFSFSYPVICSKVVNLLKEKLAPKFFANKFDSLQIVLKPRSRPRRPARGEMGTDQKYADKKIAAIILNAYTAEQSTSVTSQRSFGRP